MKGYSMCLITYNSMTLTMTSDEENWMNTSVHAIQMVSAAHIMNENSAAQIAKDEITCCMHIQDHLLHAHSKHSTVD